MTEHEEAAYPDVAAPHTPPDAAHPDAAYPVETPQAADAAYPDVAVPHTSPDFAAAGGAAAGGAASGLAAAVGAAPKGGRHAAADDADDESDFAPTAATGALGQAGRPTIHLPLDDPYQMPDGYPIKASPSFGLYYTPDSDLYHDTLAEVWFSSEEAALVNGFIKAD